MRQAAFAAGEAVVVSDIKPSTMPANTSKPRASDRYKTVPVSELCFMNLDVHLDDWMTDFAFS